MVYPPSFYAGFLAIIISKICKIEYNVYSLYYIYFKFIVFCQL